MEAGAIDATGGARAELFDLVEFLEQSELRGVPFWDGICCDLKEVMDDLSDRGRDGSIRTAFSKLSIVSRRLWNESGIEPL
jgi:hypothetical protein